MMRAVNLCRLCLIWFFLVSVTAFSQSTQFGNFTVTGNLTSLQNIIDGYLSTPTAGGTTNLSQNSQSLQYFTGSSNQTVKLPAVNLLSLGEQYTIVNLSSGTVTVQSSGANTLQAMTTNTQLVATVISLSGTGTASWSWVYGPQTGGTVTSVGMTVPSFLSVAGSPVTGSGTLAVSLSGTALPIADGGTAGTTANGAFNNLSPMTTLGDLEYEDATPKAVRLAGNTTSTKKFLSQTGTGTISAAPSWLQPACADLSNAAASCSTDTTNAANISSGLLALARGGTHADLSATGAAHNVLMQTSSGANISVAQLACGDLSNAVASCSTDTTNASNISSGTLSVARGGTGQNTLTNHGVLVGATTSAITQLSAAAANTVLTGQGASSDPSFSGNPILTSVSSATANPASAGVFRLANTDAVNWRNAGNSADLGISLNASNQFAVGATELVSGNLLSASDNSNTIGTSLSAGRFSDAYFGTSIQMGDSATNIQINKTIMTGPAPGVRFANTGGSNAYAIGINSGGTLIRFYNPGAGVILADWGPGTASGTTMHLFDGSNVAYLTAAPTAGLSIGTATTNEGGVLKLLGSTSGTVTIQPQAAAGTYNFNLPITAGTTGQLLTSQGGGSTAMTWSTVTGISTAPTFQFFFNGGVTITGNLTNAGNCVASPSSLTNIHVGDGITDSTVAGHLTSPTYVAGLPGSCSAGQIQLSQNAAATATGDTLVFGKQQSITGNTASNTCIASPSSLAGLSVGSMIIDTTHSSDITVGTSILGFGTGPCSAGQIQLSASAGGTHTGDTLLVSGIQYNAPTTTPLYLKIKMVGGGGGGGSEGGSPSSGTNGGTSYWSSYVSCPGGTNGTGVSNNTTAGGAGGAACTISSPAVGFTFAGGQGGGNGNSAGVGPMGGNSFFGGGGAGGANSGAGQAAAQNTGSGGGGGGSIIGTSDTGPGGGAGAYAQFTVNSPSATYPLMIGSGGTASSSTGEAGGVGANGIIIVEEYYQ